MTKTYCCNIPKPTNPSSLTRRELRVQELIRLGRGVVILLAEIATIVTPQVAKLGATIATSGIPMFIVMDHLILRVPKHPVQNQNNTQTMEGRTCMPLRHGQMT